MKTPPFLLLFLFTTIDCYIILVVSDAGPDITGVDVNTGITQFTKTFPSYGSGTPLLITAAYSPNSSVIWFVDAGNTVAPRYVFWDLSSDTFGTGAYLDPAIQSLSDSPGFWIDYTGAAYNVVLFGISTLSQYKVTGFDIDGATSTAVLQWTKASRLYYSVTYNYGNGNEYAVVISDGHVYQLNSTGDAIVVEPNSTISNSGFITYNRTGDILIFLRSTGAFLTQDFLSQGTSATVSTSIGSIGGITFWDESIGGTYTSGQITTGISISTGAVTTSPLTTSPIPYPTGNVILGANGDSTILIEPIDNLVPRSITTSQVAINELIYNRLFDHDEVYFIGDTAKLTSYNLITAVTTTVSSNVLSVPGNSYFYALDNTGKLYALTSTISPDTYSLYVSTSLSTLSFTLLWTVNQTRFFESMQFTPDTNDLYMGVTNGSIYHVDVNNGTNYGIISGWPTFDSSIVVSLTTGFTFGDDVTIIYTGGLNTTSGYNFLITVDRTYTAYELTKISPSGPWTSLINPNFYNGSIYGGFTTGITTAALTSGQITTSPLTSGLITTSPLTTPPLTSGIISTSPITSGDITTSPLTTSFLTSGQITTSPLTSGDITTSPLTTSPLTTSPLTSGLITTLSTTSPLTTSPLTSRDITTSPLTTSPLTTSPVSTGEVSTGSVSTSPLSTSPLTSAGATTSPLTTAKITSGLITTQRGITTDAITTDAITTSMESSAIKGIPLSVYLGLFISVGLAIIVMIGILIGIFISQSQPVEILFEPDIETTYAETRLKHRQRRTH